MSMKPKYFIQIFITSMQKTYFVSFVYISSSFVTASYVTNTEIVFISQSVFITKPDMFPLYFFDT